MKKRLISASVLLIAGALVAPALPAEELADLRESFTHETRLLDLEIERYGQARERERQDLAALRRANAELDATLADPNAARSEFVRAEREIDSVRETAYESSRQAAEARRRMYDQMRKVADLIAEIERQGIALVPASGAIEGTWKLEAGPNDVTGVLTLTNQGSLLTGSYRLSNGRRGSVRGTFAGGKIEMELIDSEHGHVGSIEGELDSATDEIAGTWQAMELTAGRATAGEWTARRLTAKDVSPR